MTPDQLEVVHAGGEHVGTLQRAGGQITFTYSDDWVSRDDATPLSLSMPLSARKHLTRVVEPFLRGLLPDNDAVLQRWGREFQVSVAHPFGLVAAVGADLPGAMCVVQPDPFEHFDHGAPYVEWLTETDVAELLRLVRRDQTAWLGPSGESRWSLAGAQAKIALLRDGDRWGRPSGPVATTHVLKPAIAALDDHDLNEHLCLQSARMLGLRSVRTSIASFGDERAVVVERYDRRRDDTGEIARIHQEDLCQALAIHPSRKYQGDGGPGPADVVRLLRDRVLPHQQAEASITAFVDSLAYNWIIAGPDAHAKNFAVLLAGRQVRLAPFYDIVSALPYPEYYEAKVRLAMKIGGYYRASAIRRSAWERLAKELRLDPWEVTTRVTELAERTPDVFAEVCADPMVVSLGSPLPLRLVDAVTARAQRCVRIMTSGQ